MTGGAGDDTYVVDSLSDMVTEAAGAGTDRVNSYINYTLGAEVEVLYLFGTATNGTGNDLNNTLVGNTNNDSLYGLGGNDTLIGGTGNDTLEGGTGHDVYYVDSAGDVVSEAFGAGVDKVYAYVSDTLDANVESLYLFGSATNATGNALNNILGGNSLDNSLTGLGGNDWLNGGPGKDNYIFSETGPINRDTIAGFNHADDTIVLKDIIDGVSDGVIRGLDFPGGLLNAANYFEGAGLIGNGLENNGIFNDTNTGNIYYNPTSGAAGDAVIICTVGTVALAVDNTDFIYSA
jgi:Ca2+-binding RTX toxin-like protein